MRSHLAADVDIDRPPAAVFRWLADPDRAARWQRDVIAYEITHRTDAIRDAEFVETLGKGRRSAQLHGRIVTFEPDAQIGFELSGTGLDIAAGYRVQPTTTGSLVHTDITIDTSGGLPALLRPAVEWQMRRQLRRELRTLRRLCEADQDAEPKEATDV